MLKRVLLICSFFFVLTYAQNLGQAFVEGKAKGHAGALIQIDPISDGTFLDLNMSFSYQTASFYGYKFFTSAWFNPKLYEVNRGFRDNKTWFELSELGIEFFNSRYNFGFQVGRFGYSWNWINNYAQGINFYHTYNSIFDYELLWLNQSALITNYKITGYRKAANWAGGLLFNTNVKIPKSTAVISPYMYLVIDKFFVPAVRAKMDFSFIQQHVGLQTRMEFLSYIGFRNSQFRGDGFLFWTDLIYRHLIYGFQVGLGVMATNKNGTPDLDVFGQNTEFEDTLGMFYGGTTTLYTFAKFDFKYNIFLKSALRASLRGKQYLIDFENRLGYEPIKNLQVGLDFLMLYNQIPSLGDFNGKNQKMALRTFLEFKF